MKTKKSGTGFVVVASVKSDSTAGLRYRVRRAMRRTRAIWKCECRAFRFAKGELGSKTKTCKHIGRVA